MREKRQRDRQADRQADRQTDRQKERQRERGRDSERDKSHLWNIFSNVHIVNMQVSMYIKEGTGNGFWGFWKLSKLLFWHHA